MLGTSRVIDCNSGGFLIVGPSLSYAPLYLSFVGGSGVGTVLGSLNGDDFEEVASDLVSFDIANAVLIFQPLHFYYKIVIDPGGTGLATLRASQGTKPERLDLNNLITVRSLTDNEPITDLSDYYTTEQVDELLLLKADAEDVYSIDEIDDLLGDKANTSDVYTKSQVDTALNAKANTSDVYTKSQVDTALSAKANTSDVYTKSQVDTALNAKANTSDVYTKSQVDTALSAKQNKIVNRVYVSQESDFGTIQSGKEYFLTGSVELTSPIVIPTGVNFRLNGYGTDISILHSSANNFTLITGSATGNIVLSKVTLTASGTNSMAINVKSQTGNEAFEKEQVNYTNCSKAGIYDNYRQMLGINMGYIGGKPEHELRGAMQGYRISTAIIRGTFGAYTFWKAGAGFVFSGRFLTDINAIIPTGATFCDFSASNVTNDEGLQFIGADFNPASSTGTVLSNLAPTSTKVRVSRCRGLSNTYIGGYSNITISANTVLTGSALSRVAGTFTSMDLSWFSFNANNEFVALSSKEVIVEAIYNGSFQGVSNTEYELYIRLWDDSASAYVDVTVVRFTTNGGVLSDATEALMVVSRNITMNQNDRLGLWIKDANGTGNDITAYTNSLFKLKEIQS